MLLRALAAVGERGPELVMFGGGERVLNNSQSQVFMSNPAGHGSGAGSGGSGYSGNVTLHHTTHVQATVDQGVLFEAVKTEAAVYEVRNGTPQQGRLAPGSAFG